MPYKLKNNKNAIEWLKSHKAGALIFECCYIETYLGHDSVSHLICRIGKKGGPVEHRTIFRVRKDFINWFEVKEMESSFINVKKFQIVKLLEKPRKDENETGLPILKLIQDASI